MFPSSSLHGDQLAGTVSRHPACTQHQSRPPPPPAAAACCFHVVGGIAGNMPALRGSDIGMSRHSYTPSRQCCYCTEVVNPKLKPGWAWGLLGASRGSENSRVRLTKPNWAKSVLDLGLWAKSPSLLCNVWISHFWSLYEIEVNFSFNCCPHNSYFVQNLAWCSLTNKIRMNMTTALQISVNCSNNAKKIRDD